MLTVSLLLIRLMNLLPKALQNRRTPLITNYSCNKPFDYYPRGRVDFYAKGKAVIYMNPHIEDKYIKEIITAFGITSEPIVRYDCSKHYKCYLDR